MSLMNTEFDALITNDSKVVRGDLLWQNDEDHSPCVEFTAEIESDAGWPLFVRGSYNPLNSCLSFALILKTVGRIYALDMGKDHHNPQCNQVGDLHKHKWTETFRDKEAYVPNDISEPATNPVGVWAQFCEEAAIKHDGKLFPLPSQQLELFQ